MSYDFMYKTAMELIRKKKESGEFISADDTVCVIYSKSGKIYTGFSKSGNYVNPMGIHAEIEAVRNMQLNENAIEAIMLVHIYSNGLILPCNNCLNYISSINPSNSRALIVVSDRVIPLNEVVQYAAPAFGVNIPPVMTSPPVQTSSPAAEAIQKADTPSEQTQDEAPTAEKATGSYLKNKVNDLMSVVDDDEDDKSANTKSKGKKLFGGLFGRR